MVAGVGSSLFSFKTDLLITSHNRKACHPLPFYLTMFRGPHGPYRRGSRRRRAALIEHINLQNAPSVWPVPVSIPRGLVQLAKASRTEIETACEHYAKADAVSASYRPRQHSLRGLSDRSSACTSLSPRKTIY